LVDETHVRNICASIQDLGITYRCSARSDVITEEKCVMLKKSGCVEVALGIETADDSVLKKNHKLETVGQNRTAISALKKYGIAVRAYFMVGLPGETKETLEKTKRFILETRPEKWIVSLFVPYPGSAIWEGPEKYGVTIKEKDWSKFFTLYPAVSLYETENLTTEEITSSHRELIKFLSECQQW